RMEESKMGMVNDQMKSEAELRHLEQKNAIELRHKMALGRLDVEGELAKQQMEMECKRAERQQQMDHQCKLAEQDAGIKLEAAKASEGERTASFAPLIEAMMNGMKGMSDAHMQGIAVLRDDIRKPRRRTLVRGKDGRASHAMDEVVE